jgi:hypothetical protein
MIPSLRLMEQADARWIPSSQNVARKILHTLFMHSERRRKERTIHDSRLEVCGDWVELHKQKIQ